MRIVSNQRVKAVIISGAFIARKLLSLDKLAVKDQ